MKTEDLINAIVEDDRTRKPSLALRLGVALGLGGAVAMALFKMGLGMRPDIASALHTGRFLVKLVIVLYCFFAALWACAQFARPEASYRKVFVALAVAPALLALAAGLELMVVPPGEWYARAVGSNSRVCLVAVPLLAIAPLVAVLVAMRAGAPRSPAVAGVIAGHLAGGLAATLYATHCVDDSPLFVALWYTPAIALALIGGALAGHRMLRW